MIVVQAVRAVFVEVLGVLLVLWLLFGTVTWTLECAGVDGPAGAPGLLVMVKQSLAGYLAPELTNDPIGQGHVAERLDRYSQLYGRAATGYLRQVTEDIVGDLTARQQASDRLGKSTIGAVRSANGSLSHRETYVAVASSRR